MFRLTLECMEVGTVLIQECSCPVRNVPYPSRASLPAPAPPSRPQPPRPLLSRFVRTDRLVDEEKHGEFDLLQHELADWTAETPVEGRHFCIGF